MADAHAGRRLGRATVYDVARRAGVSQTTVTHVLTGKRPVSEATRERVYTAISELDFRPNEMARALRRQRSHSVALVIPNIAHAIAPMFARHAGVRLRGSGYQLTIHETDGRGDVTREVVESLASWSVDGAIFSGFTLDADMVDLLRRRGMPFVNAGIDDDLPHDWHTVRLDQAAGIRAAVELVAGRSEDPIAYAGGPLGSASAELRRSAFSLSMADIGRHHDDELMTSGDYTWADGRDAGSALLASGRPFGAVVCANDLIALGVISTLTQAGLRIPDDVLITGFDNIEADGMVHPSLTSVETFPDRLAELSVDVLLTAITDRATQARAVVVERELVRRESA